MRTNQSCIEPGSSCSTPIPANSTLGGFGGASSPGRPEILSYLFFFGLIAATFIV